MRPLLTRSKASALAAVVLAATLAAGWSAATLRPDSRPALTSALDAIPVTSTAVGFTDWKQIRGSMSADEIDTTGERAELVGTSASRDRTTRSVIRGSAELMNDVLGWSAADVDWEVLQQDPRGTSDVIRLGRSVSFDDVRAGLREAGFRQNGATWRPTRNTGLPSIFAEVALVPRQRLIVLSDTRGQASVVLDVIAGKARSLASRQEAAATAEALSGNDSVLLQAGALGCTSTALPADDRFEEQARVAIERAGGLAAYRYSGRGLLDRGGSGFSAQDVTFAMTFASASVASDQAQVREQLAAGPFIGRIGRVEETLRLSSSSYDGPTVRLQFAHDPGTDVFMTGTGPVLFAACAARSASAG